MDARHSWGVLGMFFLLADLAACAFLVSSGFDPLPVTVFGAVAILMFGYVVYKRYNVEVLSEEDISLFDEPDDLVLLCKIYGLDHRGDAEVLRQRLATFVQEHRHEAFVWVAPRVVRSLGQVLSLGGAPKAHHDIGSGRCATLADGRQGARQARRTTTACPICGARTRSDDELCRECGADLDFYGALSELKVGRLILSGRKAGAIRRKLRY